MRPSSLTNEMLLATFYQFKPTLLPTFILKKSVKKAKVAVLNNLLKNKFKDNLQLNMHKTKV
jgi:hypothetical protein